MWIVLRSLTLISHPGQERKQTSGFVEKCPITLTELPGFACQSLIVNSNTSSYISCLISCLLYSNPLGYDFLWNLLDRDYTMCKMRSMNKKKKKERKKACSTIINLCLFMREAQFISICGHH